jgi:hypothetical protein
MTVTNKRTLIEHSRRTWVPRGDNDVPIVEEITLGTMQRIANACETIAANNDSLQRQLTYYKGLCESQGHRITLLRRQSSALRGVVTRLKNRQKASTPG